MDYYGKFPFVRKIKGHCTSNAVVTILREIFSEHGISEKVISNNGRQYSSNEFKMFANQWGFKHVTSSPQFPQSIGLAEPWKRSLKIANQKTLIPNLRYSAWEQHLLMPRYRALQNYCTLEGYDANLSLKLDNPISAKDQVYIRLMNRQETQKKYHDWGTQELPPLTKEQPVYM